MGVSHISYRLFIISLAAAVMLADLLPLALCLKDPSVAYTYEIGGNLSASVKVLITAIAFCVLFLAFFILYLRKCFDTSPSEPLPIINNLRTRLNFPCGLDRKVVECFPVLLYSDVKHLKIGVKCLECAVCISEFADNESLRFLPKCHHVFHPECIDEWLASHTTCPVCRADLTAADLAAESEFTRLLTLSQNDEPVTEMGTQNSDSIQVEEERSALRMLKSHSTGHSLVSPGECCERYTLRLTDDVRQQMVTLKRAKSCGCGVDGSLKSDGSKGGWRWTPERLCGESDLLDVTVARKSDAGPSSSSAGFPL
ncbi:E3 ubiquitin-protein ligase ATL6-like [Bidens hawaiensis]|uniref:E3 ubiquitin-protein ligase ATL6-like n=1 Tax=Bidens hawaiensis TaxID=980011 RepID=UPI00404B4526